MRSRSAVVAEERPFYAAHAHAYDALVSDPVEPWVAAVHEELTWAGRSEASVLDAGCGTGRHAQALIERGHRVTLADASEQLLAIARKRCPMAPAYLVDLCAPELAGPFQAITCRGVLNDLVTDDERDACLASFARLLAPDGLLFLDVRETDASRRRADGTQRTVRATLDDGSLLVFISRPSWSGDLLLVSERYEVRARSGVAVSEYNFSMRPWRRDELGDRLRAVGFGHVDIRQGVGRRSPDRLFVVAHNGVPARAGGLSRAGPT